MSLGTLAAALDVAAARSGIARDVREVTSEGWLGWLVLAVLFGLPAISLALLARRRGLALLPLSISAAVFGAWYLYDATDWWSSPGLSLRRLPLTLPS